MSKHNNFITAIIHRCWIPLAIILITIAIFFSLFRALTPWAKQYKSDVEKHLSTLIGQPVTITNMETSWYWFEPVLKLNQVSVLDAGHHALKLDNLLIGINLFSSLWHWQLQPGILYLDNVQLIARQEANQWKIDGLQLNHQPMSLDENSYLPVLGWLLAQQKIIVKNVSLLVYFHDGSMLPVDDLHMTARNRYGHYLLKGGFKLAQKTATEVAVLADLQINPQALSKFSGHVYVAANAMRLTQWQRFFPPMSYRIESGHGDCSLWMDFAKGQLSNLQTTVAIQHLAWRESTSKPAKAQVIDSVQANLALKPSKTGWRLTGDQLQLIAGGVTWPVNKGSIQYQKDQQRYRVYIKRLLLGPLLAFDIPWPDDMKPVLAAALRGDLFDTQIEIQAGQPSYFMSRFSHLSWKATNQWPLVNNLSGVVYWQPLEGRLEIDSENITIKPQKLPPVAFDQINIGLDWKELSHGYRVSLERLVGLRDGVALSASGVMDDALSPASRNLHITAAFSLDNAQRWMAYLPGKHLKKKLDNWLKQDITRIEKASGQIQVNGRVADFPFDGKNGTFSVKSRLTGVDLYFNREWPLCRDIDAYLQINNRRLDVDIYQAKLDQIALSDMSLRMDDLGLGRETLLVHGKLEAPGQSIKNYVLQSPLQKKLGKLARLDILGDLALDLRLEVPLYPENDDILVRGLLTFQNNNLLLHHHVSDLEVNQLSGGLQFDENGVTDSTLHATLLGDPVEMHVESFRGKSPYTEVRILANPSIALLKTKLNLPILALMQGHLQVTSLLTLTDDPNDLDRIRIMSDLSGVAIDLPAPLGKTFAETIPFTMDVDFNPKRAFRVRFSYGERFSSDLWYELLQNQFTLTQGELHLGRGQATLPRNRGLQLVGNLSVFDYAQWQAVQQKIASSQISSSILDDLTWVDVTVGSLVLWNHAYPQISIRAAQQAKNDWSIKLSQANLIGELHYEASKHLLTGNLEHWYLDLALFKAQTSTTALTTLKPEQIPNLNVTVDDLRVGKKALGRALLKSTSAPGRWHIEDCELTADDYHLVVSGDWIQQKKMNQTNLSGQLTLKDLENSLVNWNIPPVVEAHKGSIQFKGGWPSAVYDFSLSKASGELYISLKDGRITHLSKETEEKLGLGKLLSVLSLQTIPRRLKLDFSDLAMGGYSFDEFKGNFELKEGVMSTNNSSIDGPVAHASMRGQLDVVKQLYDLDLRVSPHITASLPVVATIAGGPIAGIATWVASKLINRGMEKVSSYTYKISGPWFDPVVQQTTIIKAPKEAKADSAV